MSLNVTNKHPPFFLKFVLWLIKHSFKIRHLYLAGKMYKH